MRRAKNRSFTLIEVIVSLSIMAILLSCTFVPETRIMRRFSDSRSDFSVSGEVDKTVDWIESIIRKALELHSDFKIMAANSGASQWIKVTWEMTGEEERWESERIAFRIDQIGSNTSSYSHRFQTLTPAMTLEVYYGDEKSEFTGWLISVSGYGFVRTYRRS
jgi:prepilin-type N-terminal cleavage/methylation domain-containing protein